MAARQWKEWQAYDSGSLNSSILPARGHKNACWMIWNRRSRLGGMYTSMQDCKKTTTHIDTLRIASINGWHEIFVRKAIVSKGDRTGTKHVILVFVGFCWRLNMSRPYSNTIKTRHLSNFGIKDNVIRPAVMRKEMGEQVNITPLRFFPSTATHICPDKAQENAKLPEFPLKISSFAPAREEICARLSVLVITH